MTIFRLIESEDAVEQLVLFVGGAGGGDGVRLSARSGVIGRAVLQGRVAAMIRDGSFDAYVQTLVEHAMHLHEARALPDDRFAFVAVPLRRRGVGPVVGVVYIDSTDPTGKGGSIRLVSPPDQTAVRKWEITLPDELVAVLTLNI